MGVENGHGWGTGQKKMPGVPMPPPPPARWAVGLAATWAADLAALLAEGLAQGLAALGAGLAGGLAGGCSHCGKQFASRTSHFPKTFTNPHTPHPYHPMAQRQRQASPKRFLHVLPKALIYFCLITPLCKRHWAG